MINNKHYIKNTSATEEKGEVKKMNQKQIYNTSVLKQTENKDIVYKKITEKSGKTLSENFISLNPVMNSNESELKEQLRQANLLIKELVNKIDVKQDILADVEFEDISIAKLKDDSIIPAKLTIDSLQFEPSVIKPEEKREGIFNDENLTEDYELGMRFYQLGLKTGFFNVKLDENKNSTRIATAEFFPNKFWPAVKQRSRWIAGICLQNWKAHKWTGNFRTKYFLFRDRKPLISFWSTFLSNIILLYFIYIAVSSVFNIDNSLITGKTPLALWYLMIFNLVFMVSKAIHRFIFTYNWYGSGYAFASIFRLAVDSFINFFAIIRSVSVYRKTKKKVVWDSTTHY